ncbi:MAG: chemotaxis protein CheW [Deltaproteobacteria bacterium]|nr:chemotaxis protein CheW [Deltaproteobacteria bacterium]
MGDKIAFKIGERTFGIDIEAVHKILEVDRVFFIPGQSGFVNGMVSLMGEPVTVIDCRKALGAPEDASSGTPHKIIVIRDRNRMVGLDIDGGALSFIWKEKIKNAHAFLGSPEDMSEGTPRFTNGMIDVEQSRQGEPPEGAQPLQGVELIDLAAVFEETKKILSEQ